MDYNPVLSQVSFAEFLDQVQDGLYVTDAGRKIVYWNRAAEELTGFAPGDVLGRHCSDPRVLNHRGIQGESLCSDESCPVLKSMKTEMGGTVPQIVLMNTAAGRDLPVQLSIGPLHNHGGDVIGAIALFRSMREEYQQRKLAMEIQRRMITRGRLEKEGVRVDTLYRPVDEIGGDFLETFFLDDDTLIATVADATGHGISASLFTMAYKTLLHASFAGQRAPGAVMGNINRGFFETAGMDGFYVSSCLVSFDAREHKGAYAAAGVPPGLVFRHSATGSRLLQTLKVVSPSLGMEERIRYEEVAFSLAPGEFLLLCSDGVFESTLGDHGRFGIEGVERFFSGYSGEKPLEDLLAELRHQSPYPLADDVSMVLVSAA